MKTWTPPNTMLHLQRSQSVITALAFAAVVLAYAVYQSRSDAGRGERATAADPDAAAVPFNSSSEEAARTPHKQQSAHTAATRAARADQTTSADAAGLAAAPQSAADSPPDAAAQAAADRQALVRILALLEEGYQRFERIPQYSATFVKQERIDGRLRDPETINLKLRHQPFSVYLKWLAGDVGRELLYVDGENGNRLLVRLGGWKGRMLPPLNLEPESSRALNDSRHPVTRLGLLALTGRLIEDRRNDLASKAAFRCRLLENERLHDRDCYCFVLEYDPPQGSGVYRKSMIHIDKELLLPLAVKNYTWLHPAQSPADHATENALDAATLIEHYAYTDLNLNRSLTDHDFARTNDEYRFRR